VKFGGSPTQRPVPVQLTNFATAVRDPALSSDGRMLAYVVQEPQSIHSQIFVQPVAGGRPQQLTRSPGRKAWPAFSPDGSQVAFTVTGEEWKWDTWVLPIVGGEAPRLLLPNAHQLQWIDNGRVLFSEFKRGVQVGVVVAGAGRSGARDIYVPPADDMAHVADLSPDGRMAAIGQMSPLSCFVMPLDGGGERRDVGTPETPCSMFVRWSPDGRWLYFASGRAPDFQLFRQPASGHGHPEQLTFDRGLAGIGVVTSFALTSDGRSVIYPSGEAHESVWLERAGENGSQLTFEGNARNPAITADGKRLLYLLGPRFSAAQIWMRSLDGANAVHVAPDFRALSIAAPDAHNQVHLWLAAIDSSWAPREIDVGDHEVGDVLLSPNDNTVFYVARQGANTQIWRVDTDGRNRRPITEPEPSLRLSSVSPDGHWISVTRGARTPREEWIYRSNGGGGRMLFSNWRFRWMPGNRSFLLINSGMVSTAWLVPNPTRVDLPSGIATNPTAELLIRLGAQKVLTADFFAEPYPGPDSSSVVYSKVENRSNLFQMPLPN
jgi:Tol biopolymer transport system component